MDDRQIQSSAMPLKFIPTVDADLDFFIHVHHTAYRSAIESMFGWDERRQDDYAKAALEGDSSAVTLQDPSPFDV